jgi:hypothetical protein
MGCAEQHKLIVPKHRPVRRRVIVTAYRDRDVGDLIAEVFPDGAVQDHLDAGMLGAERRHAASQPVLCKAHRAGDDDGLIAGGGDDGFRRLVDLIQGLPQCGEESLAHFGQLQAPRIADEQLPTDIALQGADMAADGGLGEAKLLCGSREAQMSSRALEGSDVIQRWRPLHTATCPGPPG